MLFQIQALCCLSLPMMIWLRNFVCFDLAALEIEPKAPMHAGRGFHYPALYKPQPLYILFLDKVLLSCSG